jgi:hypothetical protein
VYEIGAEALNSTRNISDENFGKYLSALGTFGDFFGGITNPIIGGVGFIALMITITLQIKQNKQNSQQSFESSIFKLIDLQNNIIENLEYNEAHKRIAFTKFLDDHNYEFNKRNGRDVMLPHHKYSVARFSYEEFNKNSNEYFGHYFRNLYSILKAIDDLPEDYKRKKYYSRIVRAQLSMNELAILFLNCLPGVCDNGEFASLLIKFQMLEHLKITSYQLQESPLDIKTSDLVYTIGGKMSVTIYEVAFYIFSEGKGLKENKSHGAFGKNKSNTILKIKETVLARKQEFKPIYVLGARRESLLKEILFGFYKLKCDIKMKLKGIW